MHGPVFSLHFELFVPAMPLVCSEASLAPQLSNPEELFLLAAFSLTLVSRPGSLSGICRVPRDQRLKGNQAAQDTFPFTPPTSVFPLTLPGSNTQPL